MQFVLKLLAISWPLDGAQLGLILACVELVSSFARRNDREREW